MEIKSPGIKANLWVDLLVGGVVVDSRRVHNEVLQDGLDIFGGRIFAGAGAALASPQVRAFAAGSAQTDFTTMATSRGGTTTAGRVAAENRIWVYGSLTTTASTGRINSMDMRLGTTVIARATFDPLLQVAVGAEVRVAWSIDFSFNHTGNYDSSVVTAIRATTGGSAIARFWDDSREDAVAAKMAEMVHGVAAPTHFGGYGEFRYYRPDASRNNNLQGEEIEAPVNWVQTTGDLNAAVISGSGRSRSFRGACPAYVRPSGLHADADDEPYRHTIWRLVAGTGTNNADAVTIPLASGYFNLPEEIPTTGTAQFAPLFAI